MWEEEPIEGSQQGRLTISLQEIAFNRRLV